MSDTVNLRISRRDAGRLLNCVRERKRKAKRGLDKFEGDFDPELGANMSEAFAAYSNLELILSNSLE